MQLVHELLRALRASAELLSMRLLPFAAFGLLASTTSRRWLMIGGGYLAFPLLASALGGLQTILLLALGLTYYLLIGLGMNRLSDWMAVGRLTRGGAAVLIFGVFLLLPGLALPGLASSTFLVVGCELALSSYSYCVETSRRGARCAPLGDCLFFLFVNPTIFYPARGAPVTESAQCTGWGRAAAGALVMFLNTAILRSLVKYLRHGGGSAQVPGGPIVALLLSGAVSFLAFYAANSGLASIQIGLMRQVGWIVPERYVYPLLSTSPMDFWRRWNTYIRAWLEGYVFLPLARKIARRTKGPFGQVAAAMATLVACGLIHDAYNYAGRQGLPDVATEFFLAAGLVLAVWRVAGHVRGKVQARLSERDARRFEVLASQWSRLCLALAILAAAVTWG